MTIRVGTASWTDPSLVKCGKFYPRGCTSPEDRLRHYADQFPMVEVDSSYYALPAPANVEKWVQRTPADFIFNIKAFRLFTGHQTERKVLPPDVGDAMAGHFAQKKYLYYRDLPVELRDVMWERYRNSIQPLHASGKLRAVHFQFAPWVTYSSKALAHIEDCQAQMPDHLLAVEFRDQSWFEGAHRERVLDFERARGLVNVTVDEPQAARNSIPTVWDVTSPRLAILRMHGQNAATWNIKADAASERFNYDYAAEDLAAFVAPIQRLEEQAIEVHVIFNNNYEDQGQRNARTLMQALRVDRGRF